MNGLSICIPVYNFNCIQSIKELCCQLKNTSFDAEILVIDDASTNELSELKKYKNTFYSYEKLSQNIGRAKIRNLLVKKSKFEHILFLDGDSGIPKNFIKNYVEAIEKYPETIVCGGRIHEKNNMVNQKLRYNYAIKFEDKKAFERTKKPYHSFMTNNFISTKEIMIKIPFNDVLVNYGHEDTLLGYELNKNNIDIVHINNPVTHLDMESNTDYIEKTKHSIENIFLIKSKHPEFIEYIKLLRLINNFKLFKLKSIKFISIKLSKIFEFIARKTGNPYSFQLFKLSYIISIYK